MIAEGQLLALVTGGRHRLGAAISTALAQAGYALAIHGSHSCELDAGLAEALEGRAWHGFVADFLDPAAPGTLFAQVTAHFGRAPDLLVNSASLFGEGGLAEVTAADLAAYHAVNCAAPTLLTQAFAAADAGSPHAGSRAIVNILDQRIDQPHGDQLAYTLSKLGLAGLTQITARTLAPGIRVNAVAPGLVIPTADYAEAQAERLAQRMPLARLPAAEEVAEAVLYLAQARSVTGQVLYVDAGARLVSFDRDFVALER
jgi:NAD(P)-dependent dehydrogenase (short-subunit alcohol dehydrogenase family)